MFILFLFLLSFQPCLGVNHWRLSDDGKRVEAVIDSPYQLKHPGSLVDFLRQQDAIENFGSSYHEMKSILSTINQREEADDPYIEERIRSQEPTCQQSVNFKMSHENFHTSYSVELCSEFHKAHERYTEMVKSYFTVSSEVGEPFCRHHETNDKNIEELLQNARAANPDETYKDILDKYFDGYFKFNDPNFRRLKATLAFLLRSEDKKLSQSVYLHLAAAAYWRYTGNIQEAVKCYSTADALISASQGPPMLEDAVDIATATLLNRIGSANVAGTVLLKRCLAARGEKETLDKAAYGAYSCPRVMLFSTCGDIAAVTQEDGEISTTVSGNREQFPTAISWYGDALAQKNYVTDLTNRDDQITVVYTLDKMIDKVSALNCYVVLRKELERQKDNLENLVKDKHHFNEIHEKRLQVEDEIRARVAHPEVRRSIALVYDMMRYGFNPYAECDVATMVVSGSRREKTMLHCVVENTKAYEAYYAEKRKKTALNKPEPKSRSAKEARRREEAATNKQQNVNDTVVQLTEVYVGDKGYERKLDGLRGTAKDPPSLPPKYPMTSSAPVNDRYWRRIDWPTKLDCQEIVSKSNLFESRIFPQVFVSPEDKGYIISSLLTTAIGLGEKDEHPFPWQEPFCEPLTNLDSHPLQSFASIAKLLRSKPSADRVEPQLKTYLVRLAGGIMDDAEMGQRIRTLIVKDIGPRFISYNLAALYWRVQGNSKQAAYCLCRAITEEPLMSDLALIQLAQIVRRFPGYEDEADRLLYKAESVAPEEPRIHWLRGRLALLGRVPEIDKSIRHLKAALECDPQSARVKEELLMVACSGRSSRPAIRSQHPTVCCSSVVHNAVCFKFKHDSDEYCYVIESEDGKDRLVYNRCNGVYNGLSYKTKPYVNIVSPFLPIFDTVTRGDALPFDEEGSIQYVDSEELPLDYGGIEPFMAQRPAEWWTRAKNEMFYERKSEASRSDWEVDVESDLAKVPEKPLSFLWIKEKKEMLKYDVKLPEVLPQPPMLLIKKGLAKFTIPRKSHHVCSSVNKLHVLLENQISTWVSVTAKGENIEKYVDLRGPIPGIAGLQPICPVVEKSKFSPMLGMDHMPAFALSDQFLFYKPEKMLTDALKALGSGKDTTDHVAARLHTALLADATGRNGAQANWLLCVLSSLYWRVVGDAPNAVGCLRSALQTAPPNMRDVVLISLANICQQAGLLHSALVSAGAALQISPNLVVIHFTLGNIYASMGDYQRALDFYYSTLALQTTFEPAKERIRSIFCKVDSDFVYHAV